MPIIVPVTVISLVSGIVTSYLPKWSYRVLMPFGMLLATVGCGLMMLFRVQSNAPLEYGCMFLVGFGLGLVMQLVLLVTQFASAPEGKWIIPFVEEA